MRFALRLIGIFFLVFLLAACVSDRQYNQAILKLESQWKEANDRTLESEGRRSFQATKQQGFAAAQLAARRIGMVVENQDFETGFLLVTSQAPIPLTMDEWAVVQEADTSQMRTAIIDDVGIASWFVTLDPSAKDLLANIFVNSKEEGIEVSVGLRLRDRKPAEDRIRRMQPPPTAVHLGLQKFWDAFEYELDAIIRKGAADGPPPVVYPRADEAGRPRENAVRTTDKNPYAVAVIIGNKNYKNRLPQVDFAHNDAEAMKRFLVEVSGVSQGNIIDLRDATLDRMEAVLGNERSHKGKLWRWLRPTESDVFIFYSGHGVPGSKDGRQYLLPVDADPNTPEIHGYPTELLYENLARLEARSVTVFLDACFSGESPGGPLVRAASGIRVTPKPGPAVPFTVLSAAAKDQVASWDKDAGHGLFTKHLLDALYGAADDKRYGNEDSRITVSEVKRYLDREMSYAARRHFGREQQATVIGDPEKVIVTLEK